ncbi:CoA pyrophosphatase [Shewanella intestini]|uniref:CoA pyrophosphatase n=1 Tax=Shewanella intestini TaxID=2017544 RepID=A0ABS5I520_9GAMM|nr:MULTISPECIES: CoA pyrophosphatase [Shewanella]MBR9729006.1 CoA pyrophosphatase [Shewanella intestini]MRG36928.1 CoA pyrophosphatase [Shewanella sp. XMDDZSB0408]
MDQKLFRSRFNFHQICHHISSAPRSALTRKAAVLIAVMEKDNQLQLILTQRPLHLRHHPGQISFPGGKVEADDPNLIATALREADEEIGLVDSNVDVLGAFPAHYTFTGFEVTPVVAMVKHPFELRLDSNEVADCFTAPLDYFIEKSNRHTVEFNRQGKAYTVHVMPYQDKFIWGVTAAIIDLLCRHLHVKN